MQQIKKKTSCWADAVNAVGWLETAYDDTYEATSRSCARSLSLYSLEGAPLGLSPFRCHRSVKKQLTVSLASWRTSASRADAGPRVCPFCPAVAVASQAFIALSFQEENKKECKKKKVYRHFK